METGILGFIQEHIEDKQKVFLGLKNDVLRFCRLLEDSAAYHSIETMTDSFDTLYSKPSEMSKFTKGIELLVSRGDFFNKFMPRTKKEKRHTHVEFFAGCGGLSYGFSQAGFASEFATDIDRLACLTLYVNGDIDSSQIYCGDIGSLQNSKNHIVKNLVDIDVVSGGPPCQGFSNANRRPLINDPRNRLYKSYLHLLAQIRPKFFVIENVEGMKHRLDDISSDIRALLGSQYVFDYLILHADAFGVPQRRKRFILIGNRIGVSSNEVFDKIRTIQTDKFVLHDALLNLRPLGKKAMKNSQHFDDDLSGFKIDVKQEDAESDFLRFLNEGRTTRFVLNHKNRYNNERDIEIYSLLPQGANSLNPVIEHLMPYKTRNHIFKDKYFKLVESELCKTITSHMKFDCNMYIHPTQARGLSPREAARVQSFPDDYFFCGHHNSWYHQIGNAVPVKMAKAIGEAIKWFL